MLSPREIVLKYKREIKTIIYEMTYAEDCVSLYGENETLIWFLITFIIPYAMTLFLLLKPGSISLVEVFCAIYGWGLALIVAHEVPLAFESYIVFSSEGEVKGHAFVMFRLVPKPKFGGYEYKNGEYFLLHTHPKGDLRLSEGDVEVIEKMNLSYLGVAVLHDGKPKIAIYTRGGKLYDVVELD